MKNGYKILLTASLLANFADNLIGPFYAVYVQKIGGNILNIGFSVAFFSICTGILVIVGGKLSEKINKEIMVIFGYGFFALGTLLYMIISNPWQLFIIQILFALGTVCLSAPLRMLFAEYIQKGKEGVQWGLESGGEHIVVGIAVLIGTFIVRMYGFTVLFSIMFGIQILAMLIQTRLYVGKRRGKSLKG